jgi:hypothetical protein
MGRETKSVCLRGKLFSTSTLNQSETVEFYCDIVVAAEDLESGMYKIDKILVLTDVQHSQVSILRELRGRKSLQVIAKTSEIKPICMPWTRIAGSASKESNAAQT